MSGMGGSSGTAMQTLSFPALAFAFALILIGYVSWDLDHLSGLRHAVTAAVAGVPVPAMAGAEGSAAAFAAPAVTAAMGGANADPGSSSAGADQPTAGGRAAAGRSALEETLLSSGVTVGCRIAMGVTMALMLLIMI
jgi:hypothetical protein